MQPQLFQQLDDSTKIEEVLLYALGDFQSRGKVLANRELALDRLHGTFIRACRKFGIGQLSDEIVVKGLRELGVSVSELPPFIAKRPFRIMVSKELSDKSLVVFEAERRLTN